MRVMPPRISRLPLRGKQLVLYRHISWRRKIFGRRSRLEKRLANLGDELSGKSFKRKFFGRLFEISIAKLRTRISARSASFFRRRVFLQNRNSRRLRDMRTAGKLTRFFSPKKNNGNDQKQSFPLKKEVENPRLKI